MRVTTLSLILVCLVTSSLLGQNDIRAEIHADEDLELLGAHQDAFAISYTDKFGESSADAALLESENDRLMVLCYPDGTKAVSLQIDAFLGVSLTDEQPKRRVLFKFDDGPVHEGEWRQANAEMTGSQLVLLQPMYPTAFGDFIQGARQSRTVYIRVYDYEDESSDYEFDLMGFTAAYKQACTS